MQAIILAPTHELVMQIDAQIKLLANNSNIDITSLTIMGESNIEKQIKKVEKTRDLFLVLIYISTLENLRKVSSKIL